MTNETRINQLSENEVTCRDVAKDLEAIADNELMKCPECGETLNAMQYEIDYEHEDGEKCTCLECGKTFDAGDLETYTMYDYFDDVYDIEYRIDGSRQYKSVSLCIAYGGPSLYVDTGSRSVELYWWGDRASWHISPDTCDMIDECFEELYHC